MKQLLVVHVKASAVESACPIGILCVSNDSALWGARGSALLARPSASSDLVTRALFFAVLRLVPFSIDCTGGDMLRCEWMCC